MDKNARARQLYADRMSNGLCRCGKPTITFKRCDDCISKYHASQKNSRIKRKNAGLCVYCGIKCDNNTLACTRCSNRRSQYDHNGQYSKKKYQKLRNIIFNHYGGKCTCCGDTDHAHLTIDHINGGGYVHAKLCGGYVALYRNIVEMSFPDIYRILCYNCNCGRSVNNNICPHYGDMRNSEVHRSTQYMRNLRMKVIDGYGGCCTQCGEKNPLFLNIDHVGGGGNIHRRSLYSHGTSSGRLKLLRDIISDNFPPSYQLLCWNCNNTKEK